VPATVLAAAVREARYTAANCTPSAVLQVRSARLQHALQPGGRASGGRTWMSPASSPAAKYCPRACTARLFTSSAFASSACTTGTPPPPAWRRPARRRLSGQRCPAASLPLLGHRVVARRTPAGGQAPARPGRRPHTRCAARPGARRARARPPRPVQGQCGARQPPAASRRRTLCRPRRRTARCGRLPAVRSTALARRARPGACVPPAASCSCRSSAQAVWKVPQFPGSLWGAST